MQTVLRYFRIAIYPLVTCFILTQAPISALAQGEHEHVSVTTYYPSPKGNFNELAIGTNLYFASHAAIYHKTRGDVVHFGNFASDADGDGVIDSTYVAIAFNVPVKFEQGVTFDTNSSVIFNIPYTLTFTVNGDVIVYDHALIATAPLSEIGLTAPDITADGYISAVQWDTPPNPGILSGAQVLDTNLGYNLGASLADLYDADVAIHTLNGVQQAALNAFTLVLDLIF